MLRLVDPLASYHAYLLRSARFVQSGATINGLHWADNDVAPYNYGDVTLMGEAAGLIMRKTAGGHTLYQVLHRRQAPSGTSAGGRSQGPAEAHTSQLQSALAPLTNQSMPPVVAMVLDNPSASAQPRFQLNRPLCVHPLAMHLVRLREFCPL